MGAECDVICNKVARMNDLDLQSSTSNKYFLANEIKHIHVNCKKNKFAESPYVDLIKSIKQKTVENKIVFTRADKGNSVIGMYRVEYADKTLEFLNAYELLVYNPTENTKKKLKLLLLNVLFSILATIDLWLL